MSLPFCSAHAAALYWDTADTAGLQSGTGVWSTTAVNWSTSSSGTGARVTWSNGSDAVFSGSGAAVTVSGSVAVGNITFTGAGWSVSGGTLTLSSSSCTASADNRAIVASALSGTAALAKSGIGTLVVSNPLTNVTGAVSINNGALELSAGVTLGGTVAIANGALLTTSSAAPGLLGQYYNVQQTGVSPNPNFASLSALTAHLSGSTPALAAYTSGTAFDFGNNGSGFPSPYSSGASNFEARWTGQFNALVSGTYGFDTASDDGSVLFIDGQSIVNNNYFQGLTVRSGTVVLTAGWHDIVIGYYQGGGGYGLYADLITPDLVKQRLPTAQLQAAGVSAVGGVTGGTGASVQLPLGSTLSVSATGTDSFAGAVSGFGALLLNGPGSFVLTGSIGAGVTTTVASGLLQVGDGISANGALGGNIVDNGGVLFANSTAQTYAGIVSGTGTLTVSGVGPLTLTGANTLLGPTFVSAGGTLQLGDGVLTGALPGDVTVNGTLLVNAAVNQSIDGIVSGTGSFAKSGPGTLTLGALAFTGSTSIGGGGVSLGSNPTVAIPALTISGTTTLYAGSSFTFSNAPTIALSPGAVLTINTNGKNIVLAGNVRGGGRLTKTGDGTLTLTGSNSYTGATTINGGTLVLGGISAMTGGFTVTSGTLLLSGTSNTAGDFTVNGGLLQINAGSLPANGFITLNAPGILAATGAYSTVTGWLASGRLNPASTGVIALTAIGVVSEAINMTQSSGTYASLSLGSLGAAIYQGTLTPVNNVFRLGGGGGSLTYAPVITGSAAVIAGSLIGSGTLLLAGSNNYSGGTTVNGCTLTAGNPSAFGSGTIALSGGDWSSNTTCLDVNNQNISNPIVESARCSVMNTGGGVGTLSGSINCGNHYFFPTAAIGSTLQITGNIVSTSSLIAGYSGGGGGQPRGGLVILAPATGTNTFTALTIEGGGTVRANDGVGLPSSATLYLQSGVFETGANLIRPLGTGSNAVSLLGGGDIGFSAYGAPVTVNLGNASTLVWGGSTGTGLVATSLILNGTSANNVIVFGNPIDFNGATTDSRGRVTANHPVTVNTGTATLTGNVFNSGSTAATLLKQGNGTLILSGSNSYDGGTSVAAGALQFNSATAIAGTGANVSVSAGAIVAAGYAIDNAFLLRLSNSSASGFTVALSADSANNLDFSAMAAALENVSLGSIGNHTYSGTLIPNGSVFRLGGGGGSLTLANPLSGSNSLLVNSLTGGCVTIPASSNYTGGTVLLNGAVLISGTAPVPAAPTYLTGTLTASTAAALSWLSHSTNETGFQIERSTDGVNFSFSGTVGAGITAFAASGLSPNQTYSFRVRAMNGTTASSYSNIAAISTQTPNLAAPTLTAATSDYQWVDLAWTDNGSNEAGFVIQQSPDGSTFAVAARVPVGVPTVYSAYTGVTGTTWFRVAACDANGNIGAFSTALSATTSASANVAADLLHRFQLDDGSRTYNVNNPAFPTAFTDAQKATQRANTTSMLAALQAAVSNSNSTGYTIPAGDYRFSGNGISITNRSNFTIATSGSVNFWYEGTAGGTIFMFTSCSNCTVSGPMTIDAELLAHTQGTVSSFDPASGVLDLEVLPGYSLQAQSPSNPFALFDRTGRELGEFYFTGWQSMGGSQVRLTGVTTSNGAFLQSIQPGTILAFEGYNANYNSVGGSGNANMTYSNMTFYCGTGAPGDTNASGGNTSWINYRCIPEPGTNRIYEGQPGEFFRNGGTLLFDGCEFDTGGDDGINLFSDSGIVVQQTGPRTLILSPQPYAVGAETFRSPAAGDVLGFYEYIGFKMDGKATVVTSTSVTDAAITGAATSWLSTHGCLWPGMTTSWKVTLDQDVNITPYAQYYIEGHGADALIVRNTAWRNMYSDAVLYSGARQVIVKDSLFQGNFGRATSGNASQYWQQGKWATNILIRNNISQSDGAWGLSAISLFPAFAYFSTARVYDNIVIDGNRIYNPGASGINVVNATNVTIVHNLICNPGAVTTQASWGNDGTTVIAGISLDAVTNISVTGNTVLFANSGLQQGLWLGPNVDLASSTTANNTYLSAPQSLPAIAIVPPAGAVVTAPASVAVQGTAAEGNGILSVTVNGIAATSSDGFAHWTATVPVALGTNTITAVAGDFAMPANTASASIQIVGSLDANGDGLPDAWETQYGVIGGALADQSGRGIPNLLCYAFGLNPNAPDRSLLPAALVQIKPADGLPYYTFSYRQLIGGGGLTYAVEVSQDMVTWIPAAPNIETVSTTPNSDGITQTVTVRYLPSLSTLGTTRRFFHVRVTAP